MENSFLVFKKLTSILPEFAKKIEPVCQKNSVSAKEGIVLLFLSFNKDNKNFCDKTVLEQLLKKGLLDDSFNITSKGSIVAKSLSSNIERLNF